MTDTQREQLYKRIFEILSGRGIKATTMDCVAQELGMSKRTLYEIFESKSDMVRAVLDHEGEQSRSLCERVFREEKNVLRSLARILNHQIASMAGTTIAFLRDLDELMPKYRQDYYEHQNKSKVLVEQVFAQGVKEGMFRGEIDYSLQLRMFQVQMEALKRSEDIIPTGMTFASLYSQIAFSFLRSVATAKGLEVIEQYETENPFNLREKPSLSAG